MLGPILGCGIISPYKKNSEGFYEKHYNCCGPVALEAALNAYAIKHGTLHKRAWNRKELSQEIQSNGITGKKFLAFFDKDAICITWPSEIKKVVNKKGYELITVDDIDSLDPQKDIAIVLIHGKFFSQEYHWVVYPLDDVKDFYGKKTVIDTIYLLKWKRKL